MFKKMTLLLALSICFGPLPTALAIERAPAQPTVTLQESIRSEATFSRKSVEAELGRKLSFKERFALKVLGKKAKKAFAGSGSTNGMAIAGFVCGLVSLFVAGFILGILGIIFSIIALNQIKRDPSQGGRGMAIAGLVLGIVGLIGWTIILAIAISA